MSLSASILLSILANETDAGDISREVRTTKAEYFLPLENGTGANQATLVWSRQIEVDPGADFYPTSEGFVISGYDDRGTITFTAIKAIYLRNTGSTSVQWLGGQTEWPTGPLGFGESRLTIPPGGVVFLSAPSAAGWATAGSLLGFSDAEAVPSQSGFLDIILIGEGSIT